MDLIRREGVREGKTEGKRVRGKGRVNRGEGGRRRGPLLFDLHNISICKFGPRISQFSSTPIHQTSCYKGDRI
jgi:hypothetical protein